MSRTLSDVAPRGMRSKIVIIAILILTLQIPIVKIESLITERMITKSTATDEVARTSGGRQVISGPVLTVPYVKRWKDKSNNEQQSIEVAYLFPDSLAIEGSAELEERSRGIFTIPVYRGSLTFNGTFSRALVAPTNIAPEDIRWNEAVLSVGVSQPKAIHDQVVLSWNERQLEFEPDISHPTFLGAGIHVGVPGAVPVSNAPDEFSFTLRLGGSSAMMFVPAGRNTRVKLAAPWKDPSFSGAYLPVARSVTEEGFAAEWNIPDLGRGFPRVWYWAGTNNEQALRSAEFGVSFLSPIDTHRMVERAVKYELLFIFLTFLCFYLFELFCTLRIHGVQYLLIGAALILFYLLLLSLSEHLGFGPAYLAASGLSISLVAGYSRSVLKGAGRSWTIAVVLAALYAFLYALLNEQDYALLIGSLGLTTILALVMYITRNVDWFEITSGQPRELKVGAQPQ